MTADDRAHDDTEPDYEPPAIEERADIGKPLIGVSGPN